MRSRKGRGPRQNSRLSSRGSERKSKSESIKDKRKARGLRENAGKPSKRLEPRKNFGMKGQAGPMRKFGEHKASPQSNRSRSHSRTKEESRGPSKGSSRDSKPSYGSSREGQRTTFSRSNEGKTDRPRRTFSRSNDRKSEGRSEERRSYGRPREESREPRRAFSRDSKSSYGKLRDEDKPRSFGRDRESPRRSFGKSRDDKPKKTYGKDREEERPRRISRRSTSEKPEGRGRKMSNRARALKDTSMGFKKFTREPDKKKPRRDYQVICANCGKQTDVPFKPTGVKPVYCKDCYQKNN
jgi:23S rRNA pseudouridine2605 synthase